MNIKVDSFPIHHLPIHITTTMHLWKPIITLELFAIARPAVASADSSNLQPQTTYLAPLHKANDDERIKGQYIIALHNDYNPDAHRSYIQENLHLNPATNDNWEWIDIAKSYIVTGLSEDTVEQIRRDTNVEEVVEEIASGHQQKR
ncbi:hypothetical protein D6D01_08527 [Aureobasidium pullulans]|uniref:Uncharacterized protein n=1 Tax=Aureobasidium pullulans TaxID=5580 RepID=A0A4S9KB87_AURPU|nr:hypothetical protein D6D01_08527 [Aureobasidium pullulans]